MSDGGEPARNPRARIPSLPGNANKTRNQFRKETRYDDKERFLQQDDKGMIPNREVIHGAVVPALRRLGMVHRDIVHHIDRQVPVIDPIAEVTLATCSEERVRHVAGDLGKYLSTVKGEARLE